MARKLRIEYAGAIYHVMNRGDRREAIFHDDRDRELFVGTLAEACAKADWQVQTYCLMGNHFHLVVETPKGNLVAGMKWLLGTYTARFNRRHKLFGHLFSGRYKSLVVDAASPGLEERRAQDNPEEYGRIRRGWCWGEEAFRKELLAQVEERHGASHYGEELQEGATAKAERLARAGLEKLAWTEADLAARRKGDGAKLNLAVQLRAETTMTLKWIAARLHMGTGASLSNLLSAQRRGRR